MKKLIAALLATLCLIGSAGAKDYEEYNEYQKNEVDLGYGLVSVYDFAMVLGGVFGTIFTLGYAQMDKYTSSGTINLGYYHWFSQGFAVGAESLYETSLLQFKNKDGEITGGTRNHFVVVMPAVKGRWVNNPHFGFYSKLAVGGSLQYQGAKTSTNEETGETTTTPASTNYTLGLQVTPLGFEFGGDQFRGFAEIGAGMQGLLLFGVKYSF